MVIKALLPHEAEPLTLPVDGMSRWAQIAPFASMGRQRFRELSSQCRAPQPMRIGARCIMYSNRELHRWFADPVNYRAQKVSA